MKKFMVIIVVILISWPLATILYNIFNSPKLKVIEEEPIIPQKVVTKLQMVMVGDALIHGAVYDDAYQNGVYDFKPMIDLIKPLVEPFDLAFYNQEAILGGKEIGVSSYPRFNSPYEVGEAMIDAGFNIVSLANNHTLDRGELAINNSLTYWKSKPEVLTAGSYASLEERNSVQIKTKNGISYALLSYTVGTNGLNPPEGKDYLVNRYDELKIKEDVERLRSSVDVLTVSMHWGSEYTHLPTTIQQQQAEYIASLGVDIIIGHHPHVIEPITKIGKTIVIYSLGNFISAQIGIERLVGLMTSLTITKTVEGSNQSVIIDNLNNELLYTHYDSNLHNFKVIPFSVIKETDLANYENIYNTYANIVKTYDNTIPVNPINK